MEKYKLRVTEQYAGRRLDFVAALLIRNVSKRKIRKIIDVGGVYLNGNRVRIASKVVRRGDILEIIFDENKLKSLQPKAICLTQNNILLRHADFFVINKPAGLPSQATRDQSVLHVIPALSNLLKSSEKASYHLTLVHRLDKETSGAMIVATSKESAILLMDQFKERSIKKVYHAIVYGIPTDEFFVIDNHLTNIGRDGIVRVVKSGGKRAITHFEVLKRDHTQEISLLKCIPLTGRTHQIRVHLASANLPILGDKLYWKRNAFLLPKQLGFYARHMLHSQSVEFNFKEERFSVQAPYPESFESVLLNSSLT